MDCTAERLTLSKAGPPPDNTDTHLLTLMLDEAHTVVLKCESEDARDAWYEAISNSQPQVRRVSY